MVKNINETIIRESFFQNEERKNRPVGKAGWTNGWVGEVEIHCRKRKREDVWRCIVLCGAERGVEEEEEEKKNASFPERPQRGIRLLSLCRMRAAGGVAIADERPVCPPSLPPSLPLSISFSLARSPEADALRSHHWAQHHGRLLLLCALLMDMLNYFSRFVPRPSPFLLHGTDRSIDRSVTFLRVWDFSTRCGSIFFFSFFF